MNESKRYLSNIFWGSKSSEISNKNCSPATKRDSGQGIL